MSAPFANAPVHYIRGGSNSSRIVMCPGSVVEAQKWPKEPSGPAAIEGTHTHTLIEHAAARGVYDATQFVGRTLTDHEGEFVVQLDQTLRANKMLGYIERRLNELRNPCLEIEAFVDAGSGFGVPQWGGSADAIVTWNKGFSDSGIEVIDYKNGGNMIAPDSYQLVTYLLGAMNRTPEEPYATIKATIVQPRVNDEPWSLEYSKEEFARKTQTIVRAMLDSCSPEPTYKNGKHCKYCPGAKPGRCAAFNKEATDIVQEALKTATVPQPITQQPTQPTTRQQSQTQQEPFAIPVVDEDMPVETLRWILDKADVLRMWLNEAEAEALRRIQSGVRIPTYKLGYGRSHRKWKLEGEELTAKLKGMGLKKSDYLKEDIRTPKQVENCDTAKTWTERKRKNLANLIDQPQGALKIVHDDDPCELQDPVADNLEELSKAEVPQISRQPESPKQPEQPQEKPGTSLKDQYPELNFL